MHFITGGTGFLGRELLRGLLTDSQDEIGLLVRDTPAGAGESEIRVRKLLNQMFSDIDVLPYLSRIQIIRGDVALPHFGLGDFEFSELAARTNSVIHSAADTALNQHLDHAQTINVGGTLNALELANRARHSHSQVQFHHISTAYVAGRTSSEVAPTDLRIDGPFRNAYEQTKAEAEVLVRKAQEHFDTFVYRPSLIVGDSRTGHASVFSHFFIPARLITMGVFKAFPALPHVPVDVVPVDWVAEAILHLHRSAYERSEIPSGSAFHLCAGVGRETTLSEIVDFLIEAFNRYRTKGRKQAHRPPFLSAEMITLLENSVAASLSFAKIGVRNLEKIFSRRLQSIAEVFPFFPYMTQNPRFNTDLNLRYLSKFERPEAPLFEVYAESIFRYCFASNWGRNPLPVPSPART